VGDVDLDRDLVAEIQGHLHVGDRDREALQGGGVHSTDKARLVDLTHRTDKPLASRGEDDQWFVVFAIVVVVVIVLLLVLFIVALALAAKRGGP